jgi:hypothetical protein
VASPDLANNYETVGLFLMQNGYSAVGAAGVCGCIAGESGGDPEAVQFPNDPESGGAGLIQWTPASSMEQYGATCAAADIGNNSVAVDMQNQMNAILEYNNAQGSSNVAELNAQPVDGYNAQYGTGAPTPETASFTNIYYSALAGYAKPRMLAETYSVPINSSAANGNSLATSPWVIWSIWGDYLTSSNSNAGVKDSYYAAEYVYTGGSGSGYGQNFNWGSLHAD